MFKTFPKWINLCKFATLKKNDKKLELTYGCPGFLGLDYEKEVRKHYFYCRTGIKISFPIIADRNGQIAK